MKKLVGVGSHHERKVQELQKDREFAVVYAKVAVEGLNNPEERGGSHLSLRAIAEACGGLDHSRHRRPAVAGNQLPNSH